mgnify:CR=1 FL=1
MCRETYSIDPQKRAARGTTDQRRSPPAGRRARRTIGAHPDGLAREALGHAYRIQDGAEIQERTLLRRLNGLEQTGRIESVGQGRATRYRVLLPSVVPTVAPAILDRSGATPSETEPYVPLSPAGAELRTLIQRPLMYREPVGYDRTWLEGYRPGVDWLLPPAIRERLHESGRTPEPERPAGTYARDLIGRLLVDLAWASSRLEGNTYDRLPPGVRAAGGGQGRRGSADDPEPQARYRVPGR